MWEMLCGGNVPIARVSGSEASTIFVSASFYVALQGERHPQEPGIN